ncbi:hypothetical protein A0H81_05246 [Grifola frondosa]|uniref:Uncharacterized protein n=1 Tax=Grifola frondosa TaxID=5627 RepID=A0A1C7MIF1_GRIFR|nr:hypothetical protein A0H81_05246 [Grifola frondosa]
MRDSGQVQPTAGDVWRSMRSQENLDNVKALRSRDSNRAILFHLQKRDSVEIYGVMLPGPACPRLDVPVAAVLVLSFDIIGSSHSMNVASRDTNPNADF